MRKLVFVGVFLAGIGAGVFGTKIWEAVSQKRLLKAARSTASEIALASSRAELVSFCRDNAPPYLARSGWLTCRIHEMQDGAEGKVPRLVVGVLYPTLANARENRGRTCHVGVWLRPDGSIERIDPTP